MTKNFSENYQHIYQLNMSLLSLARQGKWDEFIAVAENYITMLSEVLDKEARDYPLAERKDISELLQHLINNEAEISNTLKNRLDELRQELSSLNQGKKCTQAYSAPFSPTFH